MVVKNDPWIDDSTSHSYYHKSWYRAFIFEDSTKLEFS